MSAKIVKIIEAQKKPLRVPMGRAKVLGKMKRFAPQSMLDRRIAKLTGLDKAKH